MVLRGTLSPALATRSAFHYYVAQYIQLVCLTMCRNAVLTCPLHSCAKPSPSNKSSAVECGANLPLSGLLQTHNVALLLVLAPVVRKAQGGDDSTSAHGEAGPNGGGASEGRQAQHMSGLLCVANAHLFWDPAFAVCPAPLRPI
jgi:hypothetical protein